MNTRKSIMLIAAAALLLGASGCGDKASSVAVDYEPTLGDSYPVKSDDTITYWVQLHESAAKNYNSLNETEFAKALKEKSGVNVEFIHPPVTQVSEKFNLLIASGELPDIIEWGWYNFTGGPHTAIEDEVILPLNDVFKKSAPNLTKILDEHPEYAKDISTDEGEYYCFPFIRESDYLNTYRGPMFRKDILDKIGCEVPETIDEWDNVLHKMKEAGVKIPLAAIFDNNILSQTSLFLGAYGVPGGFWVDNGEVKYGPYDQEAYSSFVKLLAGWYKDGLIDPDFVDTENSRVTATNSTPDWGACESSCGGGFGTYIPAIKSQDPNAEFVPAKYPVLKKGDKPKFGQKNFNVQLSSGCAAITTQCKNVELAAKLLDFGYTDEGSLLYNFGVEGDSYNMKDGIPTYTDKIVNGDQPMAQTLAGYARASYFGPFVQAENYMKQYAKLDVQKQAIDAWSQNSNTDYILPYVNYTAEENSEFSAIMNDINTYRQETLYAFITGTKSTDDLPEYFETLKSMGIERAIEINQKAYERYQKR